MTNGDRFKVECAAALLAVVKAVQEGESAATADELAAFLGPLADTLDDVLGVAVRHL